jgi:NADPH-dependent curcumin reductase CurA
MVQNKALVLAQRPTGLPIPGKDLIVTISDIDISTPPPTGSVILRNYYASLDPYLRNQMGEPPGKFYTFAFTVGKPIYTFVIAKVLKSGDAAFEEGSYVTGMVPVEEYSVVSTSGLHVLSNPLNLDLKLFIGALGTPGLTAYSALYEIGKPKKGETIYISAASGAVGQILGQLAKREGLRVLGSVGSAAKLDFIKGELGFDDGFNYKLEKPAEALKRIAKDGVDIYFDNVGGETLDAALGAMNLRGRIGVFYPNIAEL